tara:strand:+ start:19842 stop:20147 length:306 start_codon:yes stop_codon:yes gene_type:complete
MKAKIYKPAKTSMQSGLGKTRKWVFEYQKQKDFIREPLMGWTGSQDTNEQVKLLFDDVDQAINYAKKNNIEYEVIPEIEKKYRSKLYSDNFRFDRKDKWTH